MVDDEPDTGRRLVEALCKIGLWFFGIQIVIGTPVFWFYAPLIFHSEGFFTEGFSWYLASICLFVWFLWYYLWRTDGGMRWHARISKFSKMAPKRTARKVPKP